MLLDCTLRDGGYTNNWEFGKDAIRAISQKMAMSGVEVVEVGFLRNEEPSENRAVWNSIAGIREAVGPKRHKTLYAAMAEVANPLPVEQIAVRSEDTVDIIRVIVWKDLQKVGLEYCKSIADKGYQVCIQPDRVNQYTHGEFADLIGLFSTIDPHAIYVVDSNGLLDSYELGEYFATADKCLPATTILGYHGHNNKLQALGAAQKLLAMNLSRDIMIDGSVSGVGRSSSNLNLEVIADYLNKHHGKDYDIAAMLEVYGEHICKIYKSTPWGYSINSFVTAIHSCNPNYANYLGGVEGFGPHEISEIVSTLTAREKVIYNQDTAKLYAKRYRARMNVL